MSGYGSISGCRGEQNDLLWGYFGIILQQVSKQSTVGGPVSTEER
jgi:hypothetical protein